MKEAIPLPASFYQRADVVQIAKELLGCVLVRETEHGLMRGRITETEAYNGPSDRACHAYGHRRTRRTETMYRPGGVGYVYFIYGIHHLLNVVTHTQDEPYAVLIRAVEPLAGEEQMLLRRKLTRKSDGSLPRNLTAGPGLFTQAMGITTADDGWDLTLGQGMWIEGRQSAISNQQSMDWPLAEADIIASPRVGVAYAKEDALLPYRFRIRGSVWTSPAK